MTTISFNVPNREFGFFKRLTTAQTIRNFMSIMAMLLLALTGGLTLSSCGQEDEPIHQDFPPVPQRVINLSALKAADLPDSTLTLYNGYTLTGTLNGEEEKIKIQIAHGATITLSDAHINGYHSNNTPWAGITCLGDATIILVGDNSVSPFRNIFPCILPGYNDTGEGEEYTLTIQGEGSLTLAPNMMNYPTAIGCGYSSNCGNIRIEGGTITAIAQEAAIGASWYSQCGAITITGGTIIAQSLSGGPGIGSGPLSTCGNISITEGNITAIGANGSAGIGSGQAYSFTPSICGNITITGGNVSAFGNNRAAGIGTGISSICGDISILGGIVTAQGGDNAAAIGCGIGSKERPTTCGNITLGPDIICVTAIKGYSAIMPIGFSSYDQNDNICGNITFCMKQAYTAGDDPLCGYDYWPIDLYFEEQTTDIGDMDDDFPDAYLNNTWVYFTESWFDYNP